MRNPFLPHLMASLVIVKWVCGRFSLQGDVSHSRTLDYLRFHSFICQGRKTLLIAQGESILSGSQCPFKIDPQHEVATGLSLNVISGLRSVKESLFNRFPFFLE